MTDIGLNMIIFGFTIGMMVTVYYIDKMVE